MTQSKYVSLHNHTSFSIGQGLTTPKELFEKAKELGQTAVAVTDNDSMAGMWDSLKAYKSTGVKLIAGCEFNFLEDLSDPENKTFNKLVLLARNYTGYKNLLLLRKLGFDNMVVAFKKAHARVDWKLLESYSEGLICLSGDGNGFIPQLIMQDKFDEAVKATQRFKKIFGDYFALELQPHNLQIRANPYSGNVDQRKINLGLKKIHDEYGVQCVVTTNSYYLEKEHHDVQDVLLSISSGQPVYSGQRLKFDKKDFYVKSEQEVRAYFERHKKTWPQEFVDSMIDVSAKLADSCENPDWVDPRFSNPNGNELPRFPIEDQYDYNDFLKWKQSGDSIFFDKNLADDALYYRYKSEIGLEEKIKIGKIPEEDRSWCNEQMQEEFEVFEYRNFSSYMLIVADFIDWCKKNYVPVGCGRGSCGSSLTAYLTGIHEAYPKKYGLIFARFLNKYKEAYPDVDVDFSPSGRGRLHEYLREKYKHVAHVSNVNTITPKVYARDIARVFEFGDGGRSGAAEIGNDIADSISEEFSRISTALKQAPLFAEYAKQYPELAEFTILEKKARAWSTHAGGLIINKRPLEEIVPIRRDNHGAVSTEATKNNAEDQGLIKFDTLGLETLDIIKVTYDLIKKSGKKPPENFDYDMYDEKTYDLISEGDTFGVFQLTGVAAPVCKMLKPRSIEDIALVTALIRPAAKETIPDFMKVRSGEKDLELIHPTLERALKPTYGFGLFEECLMFIASDVAGWDLHTSDSLRKMTKDKGKNPEKVEKLRSDFINDAQVNKDVPKDDATKIWDDIIAGFGGYGFNRSLQYDCKINTYTAGGKFIESKQIQDIKPGEYVRSRDEGTKEDVYIEVIDNHDHGELELVEVELDTGEKVKCTMSHKFRTIETGEMVPLHKILKNGLSIVVENSDKGLKNQIK